MSQNSKPFITVVSTVHDGKETLRHQIVPTCASCRTAYARVNVRATRFLIGWLVGGVGNWMPSVMRL
jgi:hypothetical protein